jgi:K+-transporting ATPase ATPase B chain
MSNLNKSVYNKREIFLSAIKEAFLKLNPRTQMRNPVMFVTEIGAFITTVCMILNAWQGHFSPFELNISFWLWFTVVFANFSESLAEGRGKAQAQNLKKAKMNTMARKLFGSQEKQVNAMELRKGDLVVCERGDIIPSDGEVVEGIATVDESVITGESAPVIRESGGDRSAVTGGTLVLSDKITVKITAEPGENFIDKIIALVEGATRQKTPNEVALSLLLIGLTAIFILTVFTLKLFANYSANAAGQDLSHIMTLPVLIALLVCLIPTTISGLLSAIGISGMDRMIQKNVIAMSGRAVEAAGDIDILLFDKTGTITLGNRMASQFYPRPGVSAEHMAEISQLASLSDETPEGRSIVVLAKEQFNLRVQNLNPKMAEFVPFSAHTRMSGVNLTHEKDPILIRKGALDAIRTHVESLGGIFPLEVETMANDIAKKGGTPLVVSEGKDALGVIQLNDIVKGGIAERFSELRKMGIQTVMITGDNPLTAAAIAAQAGVDDFMAQATPETKLKRIQAEQAKGYLVAMAGDGTNDAPALAQADVGVAMNTGTQAAREAGNMIDLDSNPTKLIEVVEIGKQILMTRGALTTFSIANDVAKYFAIIPALFAVLYALPGEMGPLSQLNVMKLHSSESAITSAVIFNALIIIALIPLALKGVPYRPYGANSVLGRNILIYGLGGLVAPFIGIKLIDMLLVYLGVLS